MLRKKETQRVPHKDPLVPPDYVEADVQAVRAVFRGTATPDQQRRAMEWIINFNCCTFDLSYRPGGGDLTAFAEGRRQAGLNLVWMLQYAPSKTDSDKISVRESFANRGVHFNAEEQAG